jgi:hypothetical protein
VDELHEDRHAAVSRKEGLQHMADHCCEPHELVITEVEVPESADE